MATTTKNVIKAGTRVALRNKAGKSWWHVTTRDVDVTKAEADYHKALNGDCLAVSEGDFRMFFLEDQITVVAEGFVEVVEQADESDLIEQAVAAVSSKPWLLIYDIPKNRPDIANPTGVLRRRGVRLNLSGWLLPENQIPYATLNTMKLDRVMTREDGSTYTLRGANWHLIPQDPKASRQMVMAAIDSLKEQIAEALEDNQASARRAGVKWDRAEGDETDLARAERDWNKQQEVILDRLNERLADLEEGAKVFGITGDLFGLAGAHAAREGLQTAMANRARQYVATADQARQMGPTGEALADAMMADRNVLPVALDYVEENGGDTTAARDAFRNDD